MKKFAVLTLCLFFAAPAFAQSLGEKTGVDSLLGVTPSTSDFVTEAAESDMFEIQSSQLALQHTDAPTKSFAQQMITDHGKTTAQLTALVQSGSVKATLPTKLNSSYQDMLNTLKGLQGADFTSKYHSDQVSVHKDAVSLFQRYAKGGHNTALKNWAQQTLPTLQHHLQMADALDK